MQKRRQIAPSAVQEPLLMRSWPQSGQGIEARSLIATLRGSHFAPDEEGTGAGALIKYGLSPVKTASMRRSIMPARSAKVPT